MNHHHGQGDGPKPVHVTPEERTARAAERRAAAITRAPAGFGGPVPGVGEDPASRAAAMRRRTGRTQPPA
jgi:hypothetical protein